MPFLQRWIRTRSASVEHLERLLRSSSVADPSRDAVINDLAAALNREFQVTGDRRALTRSVSLLSEALTRNADGAEIRRAALLTNYGVALRLRSGWENTPDDLASSVGSVTEALKLMPASHPQRPLVCSELGSALAELFGHSGDPDHLDPAVALHEEAVRTAGETDPRIFTFLSNLGAAHLISFQRRGNAENRERAIGVLEAAMAVGASTGEPIGNAAANLGELLRLRYETSGAPEDLARSVALLDRAVRQSRDNDPHQPGRLINLGLAYTCRAKSAGDNPTDLRAALGAFLKARSLLAVRPAHPWYAEAESRAATVRAILAGGPQSGEPT